MRVAAACAVLLCLLGIGFVVWSPFEARPDTASGSVSADPADRALQDRLTELAAAWNPRKKRRSVEEARARLDLLRAPLLRLLDKPRHPRLSAAMYLASELALPEARPVLVGLTRTAARALRAEAVMAAAAIEALSVDEVRDLLARDDVGVRIATLHCLARSPSEELFHDIVALLADPDPDLRTAAVEALPRKVSAKHHAEALERARASAGTDKACYVRALGRIGLDEASERFVTERLWDEAEEVRVAALLALSEATTKLLEARPVLELVSGDVAEREAALALYCLERTKSCTAIDVRNRLGFLSSPLAKFFAARFLIRAGDKEGASTLVQVLEGSAASERSPQSQALDAATRKLLNLLYGQPLNWSAEQWRDYLMAAPAFSARELEGLSATDLRAFGL